MPGPGRTFCDQEIDEKLQSNDKTRFYCDKRTKEVFTCDKDTSCNDIEETLYMSRLDAAVKEQCVNDFSRGTCRYPNQNEIDKAHCNKTRTFFWQNWRCDTTKSVVAASVNECGSGFVAKPAIVTCAGSDVCHAEFKNHSCSCVDASNTGGKLMKFWQ